MKLNLLLASAALVAFTFTSNAETKTLDIVGSEAWDQISYDNESPMYDGTIFNIYPVCPVYVHSGGQLIYTPEQLADAKDKNITSISLKAYHEYMLEYEGSVKLYIQETDEPTFVKDASGRHFFAVDKNATPNATASLVSNSDKAWTTEDFKLTLSTPYHYTGKNLVLTFVDDANGEYMDATNGFMTFFSFDPTDKVIRAANYTNDKVDFFAGLAQTDIIENPAVSTMPVLRVEYDNNSTSGIDAAETATVTVAGAENAIEINAEKAETAEVYNIAGQLTVNKMLTVGNNRIDAAAGLYIVKVDGKSYKVAVR